MPPKLPPAASAPSALPEAGAEWTTLEEIAAYVARALVGGARVLELRAPLEETPLEVCPLEGNDNDGDAATLVARRLLAACESDARTQSAPSVVYRLIGLVTLGGAVRSSFKVLLAGGRSPKNASSALAMLDGANQQQRFIEGQSRTNENLARILASSLEQRDAMADARWEKLVASLREDNRDLRAHGAKMEELVLAGLGRQLEVYRSLEELSTMREERETERSRQKLERDKHEWMKGQLDAFVPIVMHRALGGGPGKDGSEAAFKIADTILYKLFASLNEKQVGGIMSGLGLSPEQQVMFAELYQSYGARHEAEQKTKAAKEANGTTNGTSHGAAAPPDDKKPGGKDGPS